MSIALNRKVLSVFMSGARVGGSRFIKCIDSVCNEVVFCVLRVDKNNLLVIDTDSESVLTVDVLCTMYTPIAPVNVQ